MNIFQIPNTSTKEGKKASRPIPVNHLHPNLILICGSKRTRGVLILLLLPREGFFYLKLTVHRTPKGANTMCGPPFEHVLIPYLNVGIVPIKKTSTPGSYVHAFFLFFQF